MELTKEQHSGNPSLFKGGIRSAKISKKERGDVRFSIKMGRGWGVVGRGVATKREDALK